MTIEKLKITSIKIDSRLPNRIQEANIKHERKTGTKRTMYEFYSQAVKDLLKKEGIR